jgi:putative phosphoribosyl transferase
MQMNQEAIDKLQHMSAEKGEKKLVIVPEATHLFAEPGKLEQVALLASGWFACFLHHGKQHQNDVELSRRM